MTVGLGVDNRTSQPVGSFGAFGDEIGGKTVYLRLGKGYWRRDRRKNRLTQAREGLLTVRSAEKPSISGSGKAIGGEIGGKTA